MKTLKSLNKKSSLIIFIIFCFVSALNAEDQPIDIWNIDKNKKKQELSNDTLKVDSDDRAVETSIYDLQSSNQNDTVLIDSTLKSKKLKFHKLKSNVL